MGRGLSKLQKTILVTAYENRESEGRGTERAVQDAKMRHAFLVAHYPELASGFGEPDGPGGADCYYAEILVKHFGWEPKSARYNEAHRDLTGRKHPGSYQFSKVEIGDKQYNTVLAALSRAVARLAARGLVSPIKGWYRWSGVDLTPTGIDVAKQLTVKQKNLEP